MQAPQMISAANLPNLMAMLSMGGNNANGILCNPFWLYKKQPTTASYPQNWCRFVPSQGGQQQQQESGGYNKAKPCQIQGQDEQAAANLRVQQYALSRNLEITQINGQRKLHPKVRGPQPSPMAEVFVGKLPRDVYEDVIYPLFNAVGEIYELRLMMHFSGMNRGFCFVLFNSVQDAKRAISMLNNYEIVAGKQIGVVASLNNTKLSLWKLPTDISTEEIVKKIYDITEEVDYISVFRNVGGSVVCAIATYKTHRGAAMARRRLVPERSTLFDNTEIYVDWAQPHRTPPMFSKTKVSEEVGCLLEDDQVVIKTTNRADYPQKLYGRTTLPKPRSNLFVKQPAFNYNRHQMPYGQ